MKLSNLILGIILALVTSASEHSNAGPLLIQEDDVIALLGGENMIRLQRAGYIEAQLSQTFKDNHLQFRDLSWEGDTTAVQSTIAERWREEKYGDWPSQLSHIGATSVWAQYGKIESLSGLAGLKAFAESYEALIAQWKNVVDRITLISPIAFESPNSPFQPDLAAKNSDLEVYVQVIQTLATKHHLGFIDLFHPSLEQYESGTRFTKNGLHLLPEHQSRFANLFVRAAGLAAQPLSEDLRQAVIDKHRLWFEYWRPANWKCLFGDDGERIFGEAAGIYPSFREEWQRYPKLITQAEARVRDLLDGTPFPNATKVSPILTGWSKTRPALASAKKALADFQLLEGFEVNLFASEAHGIINPLAMRWDSNGNLFVACTTAYPQHEPGEIPNDFIVIVKDSDGDGISDYSKVFAEGLNIPTGIEIAPNGLFVGQGTQLLLLKDTDGDDVADQRDVLLSGFGNGDTHQTSNSFVWSPGGQLYWCQGDGIESRVETPWGVSRLFQAGVFRLRPDRMQLEGLLDDFMGPGNPWGIVFNDWGQPIVIDGAGGITYLGPALLPTPHRLRLPTIGRPGGYCGIDIASHPSLPVSMQGDYLIGDYKPNAVSRFALERKGASYKVIWKEALIRSKDEYFRPVDVKTGPDGAVYVCDWFNTVICHQDDSYRHTARDKGHGRIWRVAAKTSKAPSRPKLAHDSIPDLIANLASKDRWLREQSKRQLVTRDRAQVIDELRRWTRAIPSRSTATEFQLLQSLMLYETLEQVDEPILKRCLKAKDARVRAYAARTVGRWHDRLPNPIDLLSPLTRDSDSQVRMETILSCGNIPSAAAIKVAARVKRLPSDQWIDYAFTQTVRYLEPYWVPALSSGTIEFGNNNPDLLHVIRASRSKQLANTVREIATKKDINLKNQNAARQVLAATGSDEDLDFLVNPKNFFQASRYNSSAHRSVLRSIIEAQRSRPEGLNIGHFEQLLSERSTTLKISAIQLASQWELQSLHPQVAKLTAKSNPSLPLRIAAIRSLPHLQPEPKGADLQTVAQSEEPERVRSAAVEALVEIDTAQAAAVVAHRLTNEKDFKINSTLLSAFLSRRTGAHSLARAISRSSLSKKKSQVLLDQIVVLGCSNPELTQVLRDLAGYSSVVPGYSETFITDLAKEVQESGDPHSGESVFRSTAANCYSCHRIAGVGQELGPDLSNAGTGIPIRRLIEEVIWPTRHIKEGYALTQITTKTGAIIQGYERRERDQGDHIILEEFGTKERIRIGSKDIHTKETIGTIMPPTAVSLLTRPQLRDLIRFLTEIGGQGEFAIRDRFIRHWEVESGSNDSEANWLPLTSRVPGHLNLSDINETREGSPRMRIRTKLTIEGKEAQNLHLNDGTGLEIWIDGKQYSPTQSRTLSVPAGRHTLQIQIQENIRRDIPISARWKD